MSWTGRPTPWRVTTSRHVLKDRWISVRADTCVSDEGVVIDPWYVVEHPDWVQVVALTDTHRIVLIEQYRHGRAIISTELPTGVLDAPDEDPLAAARRELAEETGYSAVGFRLIASLPVNAAGESNLSHIVLATGATKAGAPVDDPTERIRAFVVPVADAVAMARGGRITQALHVAGLALALTELGLWR